MQIMKRIPFLKCPKLARPVVVFLLIGVGGLSNGLVWTTNPTTVHFSRTIHEFTSKTQLHDASEGEQESEFDFKRRMAMVRSLQHSFYKSNEFSQPVLDASTGIMHDLPMWRVEWTELPGRSNMLNVHEPMYTNMFESILYNQEKPFYFGHLYQPSSNNDSLKTWRERMEEENKTSGQQSAVVGTLMRIADYRRMEDGRLFLLVEALERFVVTTVKQELPYHIASVQLLPDTEEVDPEQWVAECTEGNIWEARSLALAESFQWYHPYEYDEAFKLPIPKKSNLKTSDIGGSMLTLVVPYVPLSKTVDLASQIKDTPLDLEPSSGVLFDAEGQTSGQQESITDEEPCLECQLLQGNILEGRKNDLDDIQLDDLEYRVWLEINNFLKSTKTPVSPVLLGLLPPPSSSFIWPSNFHLQKIAHDIENSDLKHNYVEVSPLLPSHRRLRKLSFSATTLLENKPGMEGLKQQLLEIASTKDRLLLILEKLQEYNSNFVWGEFE